MITFNNSERRFVKVIGTDPHGLPTEEIFRTPRLHRLRMLLLRLLPLPLSRVLGLTRLQGGFQTKIGRRWTEDYRRPFFEAVAARTPIPHGALSDTIAPRLKRSTPAEGAHSGAQIKRVAPGGSPGGSGSNPRTSQTRTGEVD
jgi:hypothetical protein